MLATRPRTGRALLDFATKTRRFLAVTTVFAVIVGVADTLLLLWLDVPLAPLWGLLAAVCNYIPYVGFIIGLIPPALLSLFQGDWQQMLLVIVAYIILNSVLTSLIPPYFVGDAVGLSMVLTLVSVIFWAWVLGPARRGACCPPHAAGQGRADRRRSSSDVGPGLRRRQRPGPTTTLPEAAVISIDLAALLLFIAEVLVVLAAAIYVSANRKPSSAIAWVLAVIFIPVIGILFFLLVGAGRLPKHRRDKQRFVTDHPGADRGGLHQPSSHDQLAGLAALDRGAQPQPGRAADGRGQHRRAAATTMSDPSRP